MMKNFPEQLSASWPEMILKGNKEQILCLLPLIEASVKDLNGVKDVFLFLLRHEDFLVRAGLLLLLAGSGIIRCGKPLIFLYQRGEGYPLSARCLRSIG